METLRRHPIWTFMIFYLLLGVVVIFKYSSKGSPSAFDQKLNAKGITGLPAGLLLWPLGFIG